MKDAVLAADELLGLRESESLAPELLAARVCYDHLAGERAVAMLAALVARGVLTDAAEPLLTEAGRAWLPERGIAVAPLEHG